MCDDEGHHPGDTWQKDACTSCSCLGTSMKCETKHCPAVETICEEGLNAVKVQKNEKECCEKYICSKYDLLIFYLKNIMKQIITH